MRDNIEKNSIVCFSLNGEINFKPLYVVKEVYGGGWFLIQQVFEDRFIFDSRDSFQPILVSPAYSSRFTLFISPDGESKRKVRSLFDAVKNEIILQIMERGKARFGGSFMAYPPDREPMLVNLNFSYLSNSFTKEDLIKILEYIKKCELDACKE